MNMKGKTKMEKGITLIALIITIVVLLILAAVAIAAIQNENILAHANNAAVKYNDSVTNEQGTLGEYENFLKNHVGGEAKDEVTMLSGDGQTYYTLAPSTLSFRSSADINDFQEVQINGETIDPSNYTMTEGSTIINLSIDYLKTLGEADYSISIVSKTGSPSAGFSVVEPDLNTYNFYYNQPYFAYVSALEDYVAIFLRKDGTVDLIYPNSGNTEKGTFTAGVNSIVTNVSGNTFNGTISEDGTGIYVTELSTTFKLTELLVADEDYIYARSARGSIDGYRVIAVIDKTKTSYDPIRTGINGLPTLEIMESLFKNNTNLTSIVIPDSVQAIEDSVFEGCTKLMNVVIPKETTVIGAYTFKNCSALKSVTIPESMTYIGNDAFEGCTSLVSVTYEGTVSQWNSAGFRSDWNRGSAITTIKCSDGTVTL